MKSWLPQERLSNAIGNIAQAAQIVEETLEYVKERTAFGPPIGSSNTTSSCLPSSSHAD